MAKKEKVVKEDKLQSENNELRDLLQRNQADFANYRRRNEEDKVNFVKYANSELVEQILPILDLFILASKHVPEDIAGNSWVIGVRAIEKQLEQVLLSNGLEKVNCEGQQFDPNMHEAISQVANLELEDNVISSEESPGYLLNGKLVRPAKVIVNKNLSQNIPKTGQK